VGARTRMATTPTDQRSISPPPEDPAVELDAAHAFEQLFREPPEVRTAAIERIRARSPALADRLHQLIAAFERNAQDDFLEPPASTGAIEAALREAGRHTEDQVTEPTPDSVGPYPIKSVLGVGASCTVYLGLQSEPVTREVAVKVLHSVTRRDDALTRFAAERETIAALRHPHIAHLYEAGETESGLAYFAMEYVNGPAITAYVRARGLSLRDRLKLFLQVCNAVAFAHQRGIIHRDLKPSNVLVTSDVGPPGHVKVIDFGIAKALHGSVAASPLTAGGELLGTLAYMSPEQLRGDATSTDTRTDIFALGVLLYEIVAERPASDPERGIEGIIGLQDEDRGAKRLARDIRGRGPDLSAIVERAVAPDPERRYDSVRGLGEDVQRCLDGRPVLARRGSWLYVSSKFVRRHRAASALAVLLCTVSAWMTAQVVAARSELTALALEMGEAWLGEALRLGRTINAGQQREVLATRLLVEVRGLANRYPDHPRVQSMLAAAETEVGYTKQSAGDPSGAEAHFAEALAIREVLARTRGSLPEDLHQLSLALVRVGDAAQGQGDIARCEALYRRALEIDEELVRRNPEQPEAWSNLGWSFDRLAALAPGFPEQADLRRRQAETFASMLAMGQEYEACLGLAGAYSNLAMLQFYQSLPLEPEASHALTFAHRAQRLAPDDRLAVHAVLRAQVVNALARTSVSERDALMQEALADIESIVARDPSDPDAASMLVWARSYAPDPTLNVTAPLDETGS
jgi:eukaryotic-like serine/threonine-protein kinase